MAAAPTPSRASTLSPRLAQNRENQNRDSLRPGLLPGRGGNLRPGLMPGTGGNLRPGLTQPGFRPGLTPPPDFRPILRRAIMNRLGGGPQFNPATGQNPYRSAAIRRLGGM